MIRKGLELKLVYHGAKRSVRRFDEQLIGHDGDLFLDGARLQEHVEREELLRGDAKPLPLEPMS